MSPNTNYLAVKFWHRIASASISIHHDISALSQSRFKNVGVHRKRQFGSVVEMLDRAAQSLRRGFVMGVLRSTIATKLVLIGCVVVNASCSLPHERCIEEQRVPVTVVTERCCGWDAKRQFCTVTCRDTKTEYQVRCLKSICEDGYVMKDGKCVENKK